MKKFITSTLLFLIIPILTYIIFICLQGDYSLNVLKKDIYYYPLGTYGHTYTRLNEAKQVKNVDVLFLGSSHAYRGFDTRIFKNAGYKTFNLGTTAQTPIETRVLLKRYIKDFNPKLIVFEVFQETFTKDGVESSLDILANDKNDINSVKMAFCLNSKLTYNSLIYSFYRQILKKNICKEERNRGFDHYIDGGFVEKDIMYFKDSVQYYTQAWIWNEEQFDVFEEILSDLKEKNIKTIIVQLPINKVLYDSYTNNYYFDSIMQKYGNYYNYNTLIELDDSLHFFDDDHMNQLGVSIFNNEFIEILNKEYSKSQYTDN
jgi:hypothetical protein